MGLCPPGLSAVTGKDKQTNKKNPAPIYPFLEFPGDFGNDKLVVVP